MENTMSTFLFVGVCVLLVIFGPHITIWAMNTIFGMHIGHSLAEWAAVAWLGSIVYGASK
jgi:hypothetical protein